MQQRFISGLALAALTSVTPALAAFPTELDVASPSGTTVRAEESVRDIIAEFDEAYASFLKAYRSAEDDAARNAAVSELLPDSGKYALRVLAAAKMDPATAEALEGFTWVIENGRNEDSSADAWAFVTEHHLQSDAIGGLCMSTARSRPSGEMMDRLRAILDENPHRNVQGNAMYALAMQCKGMAESTKDDAEESTRLLDEFVGLMEEVVAVYGDVPYYRGTLEKAAAGELFLFKNLSIGKVAPDIEGEDLDGVSFKLSDYRGKVVVLDFWGNW